MIHEWEILTQFPLILYLNELELFPRSVGFESDDIEVVQGNGVERNQCVPLCAFWFRHARPVALDSMPGLQIISRIVLELFATK